MKDLITEARELCEKAMPGEWKRHDIADYAEIHNGDTWGKNLNPVALVGHTDDANFIARSRALIPELCDALEKAERESGCEWCGKRLRFECYLIDDDGYTASIVNNVVQTVIANFCPLCGKRLEVKHE